MNKSSFISHPSFMSGEFSLSEPAPLFRKSFTVTEKIVSASVKVIALGLGKIFINGKPLTEDLFISPYTNYDKTLLYDEYDVTAIISEGDNLVAAALGNGFYNESLNTDWNFCKAPWRDNPKLCLELTIKTDKKVLVINSDTSWRTTRERSPYVFNQFRFGEIFDSRLDVDWMSPSYDDSQWECAVFAKEPRGELRRNPAPPIRIDRTYEPVALFKNKAGDFVYDFGQNMSGFVRLRLNQPSGTVVRITYAEELDADSERKDNHISGYFKDGVPQFSEVITSDSETVWAPDFSYYGFRYVILSGLINEPHPDDAVACFVHSAVKVRGHFRCSDGTLNKIYEMARMATLSNLFNMPTDCPTREKLGWCNDAQASAEQMIQNYGMSALYEKWLNDIKDAMKDDGDLPGIVPTGGWGYAWGSGPVSTGVLNEVSYRLYQYTGDSAPLITYYPVMRKHLEFLETKVSSETGLTCHGLTDWAGTYDENRKCPFATELICTAIHIRMLRQTMLAATLSSDESGYKELAALEERSVKAFQRSFVTEDGLSVVDEQAPIAIIILLGLSDNIKGLGEQLKASVERTDYHFRLGMVGIQFILPALDRCGLSEYAFRMLSAKGPMSYQRWIDIGATTLYEFFHENTYSCNHHMYSAVVAWYHNTILGIHHSHSGSGHTLELAPVFIDGLDYANGSYITDFGEIFVSWKRTEDSIELSVRIPEEMTAALKLRGYSYDGKTEISVTGADTFILTKIN